MLAQILDGALKIYSIRPPAAVMPLLSKNVLGFSGNRNLNVILLKNSLFPTIIPYELEHYDAEGNLLGKSYKHYLFPQGKTALSFKGGEINFASEELDVNRLSRKNAMPLAKKYGLIQDIKYRFQPELSFTGDREFYFGFRSGSQMIFLNVLGSTTLRKNLDTYGISLGLGHQHTLYGRFLIDFEIFNKFAWNKIESDWNFDIVPMLRTTLAYKPRRRLHFFAGSTFEFKIDDFNDDAFSKKDTRKIAGKVGLDTSFNFGVRF